ncbi:MAG: porin [Deltaproteobacteria bacterium]|nr:porin [Deltaproteobacteria bacterium]
MRKFLTGVCVCIVLAVLTTFLFCSMSSAEEASSVETEQAGNQELQQAEEIGKKEKIEENRSIEAGYQKHRRDQETEEEEEEEPTEGTPILSRLPVEKVTLGGYIDLDYDYYEVSDVSDKNSGSSSDLGLGSVELELRVFFNKWVKAKTKITADDVGKKDGDEKIKVDEAFFTMKCPYIPTYFVGGYRDLPFGVFEDRLITGTIIEDLYEIQEVGATLGFDPDFYGLDISFTVYRGQDIIENLEDYGTHEYSPDREEDDDVSSFIANVTLEPVEDKFIMSVFFDSEPGDGRRNLTMGSAFTLDVWKFSFDGEYITALQREDGENGEENKESAWVAGLAFRPVESVPLELVVRYEDFDNDQQGNQDEILDDRYVAGFSYKFLKWATFFFEYDYLNYEKERGSDAADHVNTFHFRIGLAF